MPVYLNGDMVLLDSGSVATDAGCCCGCSDCCFASGVQPPICTDIFGNCYLGLRNDGSCYGAIVPCDSLWLTQTTTCLNCGEEGCCPGGTSCFQTVDPVTCELTENCISGGVQCFCGADNLLSDECTPCPCNGATHMAANFAFNADDGNWFFSGTGSVEADVSEFGCSISGSVLVDVTVHSHFGLPECTGQVGCSVTVIYSGVGNWSLDTQVIMGDHSTICGGSWPPDSISASLTTPFSGMSYSGDLIPLTAITMNAHIDLTLT